MTTKNVTAIEVSKENNTAIVTMDKHFDIKDLQKFQKVSIKSVFQIIKQKIKLKKRILLKLFPKKIQTLQIKVNTSPNSNRI
jgi:hypothetical protein